ncbi:unnamed protein product [Coffea canephora]|uniref:FAE domain-containing protein n=1 Tax=Coffea canephora TaxID=49390 RepID=A0A068UNK1_COFCA|nr:unnamed protein product [Coffea canephora]
MTIHGHHRGRSKQVLFGGLDNLFKSTNVNPEDIDILVVNYIVCSVQRLGFLFICQSLHIRSRV